MANGPMYESFGCACFHEMPTSFFRTAKSTLSKAFMIMSITRLPGTLKQVKGLHDIIDMFLLNIPTKGCTLTPESNFTGSIVVCA